MPQNPSQPFHLVCVDSSANTWPASIDVPEVGEVEVQRADSVPPDLEDKTRVAVSLENLGDDEAAGLRERIGSKHPAQTRILAFSAEHWGTESLTRGLHALRPNVLLRQSASPVDTRELSTTLSKLATGDIFGLDRYLSHATQRLVMDVGSSDEMVAMLERANTLIASTALRRRVKEHVLFTVDELLTNALFNAPLDAEGLPVYRASERTHSVLLPPEKAVRVEIAADDHTVGVSVTDRFGSFEVEELQALLLESTSMQPHKIREGSTGGAGIGLKQVIRAVSGLVFNIEPGRRTEVLALFDVLPSYRGYVQRPKSLSVFAREESASA